jgi:hypothetical protein
MHLELRPNFQQTGPHTWKYESLKVDSVIEIITLSPEICVSKHDPEIYKGLKCSPKIAYQSRNDVDTPSTTGNTQTVKSARLHATVYYIAEIRYECILYWVCHSWLWRCCMSMKSDN